MIGLLRMSLAKPVFLEKYPIRRECIGQLIPSDINAVNFVVATPIGIRAVMLNVDISSVGIKILHHSNLHWMDIVSSIDFGWKR
mmetsp:Transcript_18834/g.52627  ORF Transcript_18834/g.52627 Transcript_18834/m.52627 type:complete len:84 (+) Transcript_18834:1596-1847(+)